MLPASTMTEENYADGDSSSTDVAREPPVSENFLVQQLTMLAEGVHGRLEDLAVRVTSRPVGSVLCRQGDYLLWLVEECILWSLDRSSIDVMTGKPIERPLPWIIFLPTLAALRVAGIVGRQIATLLRRTPMSADDMVELIRRRRKQIRNLKFRGEFRFSNPQSTKTENKVPEKDRILEKMFLWWPLTFVTSVAGTLGLNPPGLTIPMSPQRKRNFDEMTEDEMLDEDMSEEEKEGKLEEVLMAQILSQKAMVEDEDSDGDPDYEPKESESDAEGDSDVTSVGEDIESSPESTKTEMELVQETLEEMVPEKLTQQIGNKDSDGDSSETLVRSNGVTEATQSDAVEKEVFYSAKSSIYTTPEMQSVDVSRETTPARESVTSVLPEAAPALAVSLQAEAAPALAVSLQAEAAPAPKVPVPPEFALPPLVKEDIKSRNVSKEDSPREDVTAKKPTAFSRFFPRRKT